MKKLVTLAIATTLLCSCSKYYPLPVSKPTKENYNAYKDENANVIPFPTDYRSSKIYAWVYAEHYRNKKIEIFKSLYGHSDWSMGGTIAALIAGVAKSTEGVIAGGAFAGGAEIAPSRYQFTLQATNFESAEKGAMCIFEYLDKLKVDEQQDIAIFQEVIGKEKDQTVEDYTHSSIKQIHARLENSQARVTLLAPNLDKLEQALEKVHATKIPSDETPKAADEKADASIVDAEAADRSRAENEAKAAGHPLDASFVYVFTDAQKQAVETEIAGGKYNKKQLNARSVKGDKKLQYQYDMTS